MNALEKAFRKLLAWLCDESIKALIVAFCAGHPVVLENISVESVGIRIKRHLAEMPLVEYFGVHLMILTVAYAFPPLSWKFRPFRWLSVDAQIRILDRWAESRFMPKRITFSGLKYIFLSQIYSEPRLLELVGYDSALKARTSGNCRSLWEKA